MHKKCYQEPEVQRLLKSWFKTTSIVFYNNISAVFLYVVTILCSFFTLKELFQVKIGLTKSLLFFFLKMPKIWVGRMTLNGEKKEDGLSMF